MDGVEGDVATGAPLTPERIVRRTLELLDVHGVEWLSMRKLAAELGVSAQALYWHFPNKDALCEAVVATVAEELRALPLGRGSVERRLQRYCIGLRDHWRRHPSAIELGRRYVPSAAGATVEQGVRLVVELGYAPDDALERLRAVIWIVLGFVQVEQNLARSAHHRPLDASGRRWTVQLRDGEERSHRIDTDALFAQVTRTTIAGLRAEAPPHRAAR
jgi:AcrR family transcriptional regulator